MEFNSEVSLTENASDLYFYDMCMCECVPFKGRHLNWMRGALSQNPALKCNMRTVFRSSNQIENNNRVITRLPEIFSS